MKIKSLMVAACLSACAASAMARTDVTIGTGMTPFSGEYIGTPAAGDFFLESIVFKLSTPTALSATFKSLGGAIDITQAYVEPNLIMSIPENPIPQGPTFKTIFVTPIKTADGYTFDLGVVPAGNIIFGLSGKFGEGVTGFTGSIGLTSAVPEASTLVTMSLGLLGLAGLAARNKRRAQGRA